MVIYLILFSIKSDENVNFCELYLESWELLAEDKTLYGQVDDALIGGLRPAVIYQVRVFAENEMGRSKEGRVLQVFMFSNLLSLIEIIEFRRHYYHYCYAYFLCVVYY